MALFICCHPDHLQDVECFRARGRAYFFFFFFSFLSNCWNQTVVVKTFELSKAESAATAAQTIFTALQL